MVSIGEKAYSLPGEGFSHSRLTKMQTHIQEVTTIQLNITEDAAAWLEHVAAEDCTSPERVAEVVLNAKGRAHGGGED